MKPISSDSGGRSEKMYMGVSKNSGTPKWMVYNGKPYQNGWFGGPTPIFGNTHIDVSAGIWSMGRSGHPKNRTPWRCTSHISFMGFVISPWATSTRKMQEPKQFWGQKHVCRECWKYANMLDRSWIMTCHQPIQHLERIGTPLLNLSFGPWQVVSTSFCHLFIKGQWSWTKHFQFINQTGSFKTIHKHSQWVQV